MPFLRKKTNKKGVFWERAAELSDNRMTIVILSPEPAARPGGRSLGGRDDLDDPIIFIFK